MIKVIAFDFSGVIIQSLSSDEKILHVKKSSQIINKYLEISNKMDLGLINKDEASNLISDLTGIKKENIWSEIYLKSKINSDLIRLIKILKINYKIFLFSNYMSYYLKKLLLHYDINGIFDELIISSDYGLIKPDNNFYEILLKNSGVNENELIFIDDKLENVYAAKKFGIKAIHFTSTQNLIKEFKKEGLKI